MAVSEKLRKKLLQRKEALKKGNGEFNTIFFKEGTTRIRILFVGADNDFVTEALQFFIDGESVITPASLGEPCAIMEMYQELKSGTDEDKLLAKKIAPSKRWYAPAIKYTDETGKEIDGQPRLAILTKGVYETLIEYMLDEENGDFTDPKEGYDVKIVRSGKGKTDTEYKVLACRPSALPKELRGKVFNPEEMVRELIPSYDKTKELADKLLGIAHQADTEDDDDAPKPKKKRVADTEDDDEDTPRPKKKLGLKKKKIAKK